MYYAKAMYKGGTIVCADKVNYSSYVILGLRCLECGEEVCLRRGDKRQTHFAHFKNTVNDYCSLRIIGNSCHWSDLTIEGKGQRRKIFQQYFLNIIIKSNDRNFFEKIKFVRYSVNIVSLNLFLEACRDFFYNNKSNFIDKCYCFISNTDNENSINNIIASEAVDYLSIPSSYKLLCELFNYCIYNYCQQKNYKKEEFVENSANCIKICQLLINILIETNWAKSFQEYDNNSRSKSKNTKRGDSDKKQKDDLTNRKYKIKQKYNYKSNLKVGKYINLDGLPTRAFDLEPLTNVRLHLQGLYLNLLDNSLQENTKIATIAVITNYCLQSNSSIVIELTFEDYPLIEYIIFKYKQCNGAYLFKLYQNLEIIIKKYLITRYKHFSNTTCKIVYSSQLKKLFLEPKLKSQIRII